MKKGGNAISRPFTGTEYVLVRGRLFLLERNGGIRMISLRNIRKTYNDRVILNGIDVDIEQGSVVTLIGPSGTGKTTLLKSINLLERPDAGEISIEDVRVTAPFKDKKSILELRRNTAMVFQQYNLFRNQTVLKNVMQPQIVVKGVDKQAAKEKALEVLGEVGMQGFEGHYPIQLSGGQQQRVSIARALALDPKAILFDEPTSALDPELSREVLKSIKKVANLGITIILATHEMSFAEEISDQVIFMEKGEIVEQGTPYQVFHDPASERTRDFIDGYRKPVQIDTPKQNEFKFKVV